MLNVVITLNILFSYPAIHILLNYLYVIVIFKFYSGWNYTLNYLQNTYKIYQGCKVVKQVIKDCVVCKKVQAQPLRGPDSPDLPSQRLSKDYAFSNTGVDFAGPFYVKNIYGDSDSLFKCYICLFTCATTRNVHLELRPSMSAQHLISYLKRFTGCRGKINLFISDNFETFVSYKLKSFLSSNGIRWKYIIPLSPWWGGFYERLIRIVKSTLRQLLGKIRLNYEELSTIITEIEDIINTRPLTYLYDDDDITAITPSHLVIGQNLLENMKNSNIDDFDMKKGECTRRYKYLKTTIEHFWN